MKQIDEYSNVSPVNFSTAKLLKVIGQGLFETF